MKGLQGIVAKWSKSVSVLFNGKYALWANTVSGGVLFMIGDVIEQKIEITRGKHEDVDWKRVGKLS